MPHHPPTPPGAVDLDAIGPDGWAEPNTVLALVAELRAAREVIKAARAFESESVEEGWHLEDCTPDYGDEPAQCAKGCPQPPLAAALAAYHHLSKAER